MNVNWIAGVVLRFQILDYSTDLIRTSTMLKLIKFRKAFLITNFVHFHVARIDSEKY